VCIIPSKVERERSLATFVLHDSSFGAVAALASQQVAASSLTGFRPPMPRHPVGARVFFFSDPAQAPSGDDGGFSCGDGTAAIDAMLDAAQRGDWDAVLKSPYLPTLVNSTTQHSAKGPRRSVLHHAAMLPAPSDVIARLVSAGALRGLRCRDGRTPFDVAAYNAIHAPTADGRARFAAAAEALRPAEVTPFGEAAATALRKVCPFSPFAAAPEVHGGFHGRPFDIRALQELAPGDVVLCIR
jgi:hypothetical protein